MARKDPIYDLIEEHREVYTAWKADINRTKGLESRHSELYRYVSQKLFDTAPASLAGVLALVEYVIDEDHDDIGHWGAHGVDFAGSILRSIREGLLRRTRHRPLPSQQPRNLGPTCNDRRTGDL